MRAQAAVSALMLATALVQGCGEMPPPDAGGVSLADAWSPPTPAGVTVGAVYLSVASATGDRLVGVEVSPDIAAAAEMHVTVRGVSGEISMSRVGSVSLPPSRRIDFAPGGRHVMLVGLVRPLKAGDVLALRLRFETAGLRTVDVPVRPR
jgi:periplasmic copper chaperone A